MAPKKAMDKSGEEKKRAPLSLEAKKEIISKHERGVRLVDIAKEYGRKPSTIGTVLKQKEAIKGVAAPAKGVTTIAKQRTPVHDKMEHLLFLWIKEKERAGDTVSTSVICEKARAIFEDLASKEGGERSSSKERQAIPEFKASRGWFDRFKKRTGIHSVVRHGEASSADHQAVEEFVQKFKAMVEEDLKALAAVEEELFGFEKAQEEEAADASIRTSEIKDILRQFHDVADFVEKNHPEKVSTSRAIAHFDDVCLSHFRNLVKSRQKQTSLDRFFSKQGEPPSKKGKGAGDS